MKLQCESVWKRYDGLTLKWMVHPRMKIIHYQLSTTLMEGWVTCWRKHFTTDTIQPKSMVTDSSNTTWCKLPGFESNCNVGAEGHLVNWAGAVRRLVTVFADPVTCCHLIMLVDHDPGGSWWWILMIVDDGDVRSWWWILIVGSWPLPTIIQWKYSYFSDVLHYMHDYCTCEGSFTCGSLWGF